MFMKRILILLCAMALAGLARAEIYKYVDEDGSVVFTDQPPTDDAKPADLPGLSVIEASKPLSVPRPPGTAGKRGPGPAYPDLAIASPRPDENVRGTGNMLSLRLTSSEPLREGDKLMVYLDGREQGAFSGFAVDLKDIPRGEHQVSARIVGPDGQEQASAGPVTFYMRQHSQLFQNQPLRTPTPLTNSGGG